MEGMIRAPPIPMNARVRISIPAFPAKAAARVPEPKTTKARIHFDVRVADIETEAKRLEQLGARRIDIGQGPDPGWIAMADPEGNEFCVCPGIPLPPAL